MYYTVRSGDTLWNIASRFSIDPVVIAESNRLSLPLRPGQVIYIPYGSCPQPRIVDSAREVKKARIVGMVAPHAIEEGVAQYQAHASCFTDLVLPCLTLGGDGIKASEAPDLGRAKCPSVGVWGLVTNLDGSAYQSDAVRDAVSSEDSRRWAAGTICEAVKSRGYSGVMIDLQSMGPSEREGLACFVAHLRQSLPQEATIALVLPPVPHLFHDIQDIQAFDLEQLRPNVDVFMVQGFGRDPGRGPGPIAPGKWLRDVMRYVLYRVGSSKSAVMLGGYGLDWDQSGYARYLSCQEAAALAEASQSRVCYDMESESCWFSYRDSTGEPHTVWFEDPCSFTYKVRSIEEYGLAGIGLWRLGGLFPDMITIAASMDRGW